MKENFQRPWSLTLRIVLSALESAWGASGDARLLATRELLIMVGEGDRTRAVDCLGLLMDEVEKANGESV